MTRAAVSSSRAFAVVGAFALVSGLLAGCSQEEEKAPEPSPADRLASAKAQADAATSVHVVVTSRDVPENADGVIGLDATGTHTPAFTGTVTARIRGIVASVDSVAIGPDLWLKLPFTSRFVKTSPAEWGLPSPVRLFSTENGLSSLLTHTENPVDGGQAREGEEVLRTITGTVAGSHVSELLATGDVNGTFEVSYGLTDTDVLRKATLSGPFFTGATSTYDVMFDRYGEAVEITPP
ncbi:MAG: LppX_LprAFG lipoprotein [Dermatophilus congolensis]|nr:LppX_LprAFG lipoprotein [Dermatophilus congolensis]